MNKVTLKIIIRDIIFLIIVLCLLYYLFFFNYSFLQKILDIMFYGGLMYVFLCTFEKYIYRIPFSEWKPSDQIIFIIALSCFLFSSGTKLEQKTQEYNSENTIELFSFDRSTESSESFAFPDTVWHNDSSGIFHCVEHCEGTMNANEYSTEYMEEIGVKPCKRCFVYITKNGSRYHDDYSCSGMENPMLISITSIDDSSYEPCQKCYKNNTSTKSNHDSSDSHTITSSGEMDFTDMLEEGRKQYEETKEKP